MKRGIIFFMLGCLSFRSQIAFKSIMQEEYEKYSKYTSTNERFWDSIRGIEKNSAIFKTNASQEANTACNLTHRVFGWHPYWAGSAYQNYQWAYLSDLCYFNYEINPSTGQNSNASFAWSTASVVTVAKNQGKKIHICATLFSNHSTFWNSVSAQNTFINNIINLLNTRGGHGVNIDFEGMGSSDKTPFVNFITNLRNALTNANPNYELSICLYAVDWSGTFNIPALNSLVNYFTIMGYDYYWSGSSQAGPTDPLYNFVTTYNYTLSKTITYYIKQGASPQKLLLGLPYYGREWEVSSTSIPASTTGNFSSARTLAYINNNPGTYSSSNKFWDYNSFTPLYKYTSGSSLRQCFINDVYSMGRRYEFVRQRGIGGIAIWALSYDDGMTSFWNLLKDKFTDCYAPSCSDSLYDMGGPTRNYYDNEKYEYLISVPSGSLVKLQFYSFGLENGYDTLWLYDGPNAASPLIGAYTGTQSPGTFTASGSNVYLKFKSDGATNSFGFRIYKTCVPPNVTTLADFPKEPFGFSVFPQPAKDMLFVIPPSEIRTGNILIKDLQGRTLIQYPFENTNVLGINISHLPASVYFMYVTDDKNNNAIKKFIKSD